MAQVTRLGLYGGPRPVYGSFVGKQEVKTNLLGFEVEADVEPIEIRLEDTIEVRII